MQTSSDEFHSHRAAELHPKTPVPSPAKDPIIFRLSPLIFIGEKNSLKSPPSPAPKPSVLAAARPAALNPPQEFREGLP
jgi:hypothetical protein